MRRRERPPVRAAAFALILLTGNAAAADPARTRFLAERHCWIGALLTSIHERGPTTSRDRFVTLALTGDGQKYVQCIFQGDDTRMLCEASSGAYRYRDGQGMRLDMAPDSVAALKALGFTLPDPKGNFVQEIELGSPPRLDAVATLMLASLYDAYQADATSVVEWKAPKAAVETTRCALAYIRAAGQR